MTIAQLGLRFRHVVAVQSGRMPNLVKWLKSDYILFSSAPQPNQIHRSLAATAIVWHCTTSFQAQKTHLKPGLPASMSRMATLSRHHNWFATVHIYVKFLHSQLEHGFYNYSCASCHLCHFGHHWIIAPHDIEAVHDAVRLA